MDTIHNLSEIVFQTARETLTKLAELNIPPYPKYYHDTFVELLQHSSDARVKHLLKNYRDLFVSSSQETKKSGCCADSTGIDENTVQGLEHLPAQILQELQKANETITWLKREVEQLKNESYIDPLTKTFNRRALFEDLEAIIHSGLNHDLDMNLALFDIDDFKKVNDSFGHVAGDKMLVLLSQIIQNTLRKETRVYRYGGEEFVILLNRTSMQEAMGMVERILKKVDETNLLYNNQNIHLTMSAGVYPHKKGILVEEFLNGADKALYKAKLNGKNCYKVGC